MSAIADTLIPYSVIRSERSTADIVVAGNPEVELSTFDQGSIQLVDNPNGATPANTVSLWQSQSTAARAVVWTNWYARSNRAAVYFRVSY